MRVLVTGASGFIGRRLVSKLKGAVVLSRDPEAARRALGDVEAHRWEPAEGPPPAAALEDVEAVFNLAGESVAGRWSTERKRKILESRVNATRNLVSAIAARRSGARPAVLISASAVGYYGPRGEDLLDESAPAGDDFLAEVCVAWEAEAARAREVGVRVVSPRIGIVLGPGGGALRSLLRPFKLGLGGRLGDGKQWMSWIHLDDVVGLLLHAKETRAVAGAMNTVAPAPVTNREFTRALGAALMRPALLPVPSFALRIALGEFAGALLGSQRVEPRVALATGYRFAWPSLDEALRDCVGKPAVQSRPSTGTAPA